MNLFLGKKIVSRDTIKDLRDLHNLDLAIQEIYATS